MSRVTRVVWWVSIVWLALAAIVLVYCLIWWLTNEDNPARYEIAIESALVLLFSLPAGLGALFAGVAPRTGLSTYKRVGGVCLLLFCIIVEMSLDYLQTRYR